MTRGERRRAAQTASPLKWLSTLLWPDGQAELVPGRGEPTVVGVGHGEVEVGLRWWASPSAEKAEIIIPATSTPAARTAVRRYHDGFTLQRRARSWAAELMMRSPAVAGRVVGRHSVAVSGQPAGGLLDELAEALAKHHPNLRELHVAVSLARPKSNRKPVLQLIDQHGECLGWAKIGWNPWTTQLVGNEAHWLQARPSAPLITPELVADFTSGEDRVVITSGVVASRWPRRRKPSMGELVTAIADLGTRDRLPIAESAWWKSVEAVRSVATPSEARAIGHVSRLADGLLFDVGAWHGDLTPWNIMSGSSKSGSAVIDWEFAADGVPVGFDLCHYQTQVASELKGMTVDEALDYSARLSPQGLAAIGVDPHNQIAVFGLYLVELIRRTLALRAAGMPVDDVKQGAAAVRRIRADLLSASAPTSAGATSDIHA